MKYASLLLLAAAFMLGGCESGDEASTDLDRVVLDPMEGSIPPGGEIMLNAVGLTADGDTLILDYVSWSAEPETEDILTAGDSYLFFTAGVEEDSVTITAESEGKSGTSVITVSSTSDVGIYHNGSILSDQTWDKAQNPHVVNGDIFIDHPDGVALTIEAGCVVKFDANAGILVGYDGQGALIAAGTETDSITFTSYTDSTIWDGITFTENADYTLSTLQYCNIEFGGGNGFGSILIDGDICPDIVDSYIANTDSMACGIYGAAAGCDSILLSGNMFYENAGGDICP